MKQLRIFFLIYFLFLSYPVWSAIQSIPKIPIIIKGYVEAIKKQQQTLKDIEGWEQKGIIPATELSDLKKEIQKKVAELLFKILDEIEDSEQKDRISKESSLHMKRSVREEIVLFLKHPEFLKKFRERLLERPSENPDFLEQFRDLLEPNTYKKLKNEQRLKRCWKRFKIF